MGRVGRFILKVAAVLILIVSAGTFALSLRMISVIYTQQVQKGRCKKTQSSFFTSPHLAYIFSK